MDGSSGRGLVVLDVHAPTETVWDRILDYDNYAKMVSGCTNSKNYQVINHKPSKSNKFLSQTIYTRMKIGLSMIQLEYFIKHSYHPQLNVLTWTLDYTKTSDLDDSVGYWYVVQHPTKGSDFSRVYYSVDVALPSYLPGFVKDFFSTKALTDATSWVKRESEKKFGIEASKKGVDASIVGAGETKKKRFWNKFGKKGKNEEETCVEESAEESSEEQKSSSLTVGTKRASMIFLVFVLSLYNIGLFLERISSN